RSRSPEGNGAASSARLEHISERVPKALQPARRRGPWRRRNDVSGLSAKDKGGEMRRPHSALGILLALRATGYGQQNPSAQINVLPVQGNVYMLVGATGNIAVQVGNDGALMVDTGTAQMADQVIATVKQLAKPITGKPLRFIINTHFHPDHTGGNEKARAAGTTLTGGHVAGNIQDATEGAALYAHENVMKRMSAPTGAKASTPSGAWPTDTYYGDEQELFFN